MPSNPSPYRFAAVSRVARITPNMQRITLSGGDLTRFVSSGDPDERLLVVFPGEGEGRPPQPQPIGETWDYPVDGPRPEMRSYTVRRWNRATCEMDIDFAVHDGGAAVRWALQARPGQVLGVTTASGWYRPPAGTAWQLLIADMTALPAVGRIVEELAPGTRVHVVAEVTTPADEQRIETAGDATYTWLHGTGNGVGPSAVADTARKWDRPGGPGYIWFAGEAGCSREVRRWVRHQLGWPTARYDVIGYWRAEKEAWTARYEQVRDRIEAAQSAALAAGGDFDAVRDAVDAAMDENGL
ncbi:siderophore-interacting protein [Prescottella agglutinans]|uniref:Siderophore-interacting protein n=1 Tax=Prescottella agglutinans TaxID=1644129 RepID=A0A3S3AJK3_9NOCA|nr:siderophore-interacting protein [Prescottella agglutinans]RVW11623.1 siderophore-interacting protein [Prescottella agglutinans]